jgi:uncharacterized ubiquitin-like protein YukD
MFREYTFEYNGFNFVSSIDVMHPAYQQIKAMPAGMFEQMNISMLKQLFSKDVAYTKEDILSELERINNGGSYAFINLAGDN